MSRISVDYRAMWEGLRGLSREELLARMTPAQQVLAVLLEAYLQAPIDPPAEEPARLVGRSLKDYLDEQARHRD